MPPAVVPRTNIIIYHCLLDNNPRNNQTPQQNGRQQSLNLTQPPSHQQRLNLQQQSQSANYAAKLSTGKSKSAKSTAKSTTAESQSAIYAAKPSTAKSKSAKSTVKSTTAVSICHLRSQTVNSKF